MSASPDHQNTFLVKFIREIIFGRCNEQTDAGFSYGMKHIPGHRNVFGGGFRCTGSQCEIVNFSRPCNPWFSIQTPVPPVFEHAAVIMDRNCMPESCCYVFLPEHFAELIMIPKSRILRFYQ